MLSLYRNNRRAGRVLLAMALLLAAPACMEDSDADNQPESVACSEAQPGDPCSTSGDSCISAPGNCPYDVTCSADNRWEFVCNAPDDVPCYGACL